MKKVSLLSFVVLVCGVTTTVRADTIFNVNATLTQTSVANPGTTSLKGTLGYNSSTGALTQVNFVF